VRKVVEDFRAAEKLEHLDRNVGDVDFAGGTVDDVEFWARKEIDESLG
jgi:hypothetical protein